MRIFKILPCCLFLFLAACNETKTKVAAPSAPPPPKITSPLSLFGTVVPSGSYKAGEHIDISVIFGERVMVNTQNGTPRIVLSIGSVTRYADYHSGSGGPVLIFRYTVVSEDGDSEGIAMAASIALNSGDIKNDEGKTPDLTLASPGNLKSVVIDNTPPVVSDIVVEGGTYQAEENIDFYVQFSEDVTIAAKSDRPELSLTLGGQVRKARYYRMDGSRNVVFRYKVISTDNDMSGISLGDTISPATVAILDRAGHKASLSLTTPYNLNEVWIDNAPPTISSVSVSSGTYRGNENVDIRVTFSENVSVDTRGGVPRLALTVGSARKYALYQSGRGSNALVFRYIVNREDRDDDGISLSPSVLLNGGLIRDTIGHDAVLDFTIPPNLSSVFVDAQTTKILEATISGGYYNYGDHIDINVRFNKIVTVDTTGGTPRIPLVIGNITRYADYYLGSGRSDLTFRYTVQSGDNDSQGIAMTSSISLNYGDITNQENKTPILSFTLPDNLKSVIIDNTSPIISNITVRSGTYKANENIDLYAYFDEAVTVKSTSNNRPELSLTIGNNVRKARYHRVDGDRIVVFRYKVTSADNDTDGIALSNSISSGADMILDKAGNTAYLSFTGPSNLGKIFVDNNGPTISSVDISSGTYRGNENVDIKVTFSENVSVDTRGGVPRLILTVGSARKYALYQSGRGSSALIFRYIVDREDRDDDGISLSPSILLNGGLIRDTIGHDAVLDFTIPSNLSSVFVDAQTTKILEATISGGYYNYGDHIDINVRFNKIVTVDTTGGTPRIPLVIGNITRYADYYLGSGRSVLIFRYTVQSGDNDSQGVAMTSSISLNYGEITNQENKTPILSFTLPDNLKSVIIDNTSPIISNITVQSGTYKANENIDLYAYFNEAVTVKSISNNRPELSLTIGSDVRKARYHRLDGDRIVVFRYKVTSADNDTDGIVLSNSISSGAGMILDKAGNTAYSSFIGPSNLSKVFVDNNGPTISSVDISSGTYRIDENLDIKVIFSEEVTVDTRGGTPQMVINIGGKRRYALYQSGRGSRTLTFRYIVNRGDEDKDGISLSSSIIVNGGLIRDTVGNDAVLNFTVPTNLSSIVIDAQIPKILEVTATEGTYGESDGIDISIRFSENVTVGTVSVWENPFWGTPFISLIVGDRVSPAYYYSGSGTSTLIFRYIVGSGDEDSDGLKMEDSISLNGGTLRDSEGNDASLDLDDLGSLPSVFLDSTSPRISIITLESGTYKSGDHVDIVATFSEDVIVDTTMGTPRIDLTVGSASRPATYHSGSGTTTLTFRYSVGTIEEDDNGITMTSPLNLNGATIRDLAGNNAYTFFNLPMNLWTVLVDNTAPVISSVSVPSGNYAIGDNIDMTVTLSEAVSVDLSEGRPLIPITIGGKSKHAKYLSGSGPNTLTFRYTVAANDNDRDGIDMAASITPNGGIIQDLSGNRSNLLFTPPSNTLNVLVDGIPPNISKVNIAEGNYVTGQAIDISVTFDENVTVTGIPRIALKLKSPQSAFYHSGSSTSILTFRYSVSATDEENDDLRIADTIELSGGGIKDSAGNDPSSLGIPKISSDKRIFLNRASHAFLEKVSAGGGHTCALAPGGEVRCWGSGTHGQLGNNSTANSNVAVTVVAASGSSIPLKGTVQISAGTSHTCALNSGGEVRCWGYKANGGSNSSVPVVIKSGGVVQISAGGNYTCALDLEGEVWCWGTLNGKGVSGRVLTGSAGSAPLRGIVQISSGDNHACALNKRGEVQCWGAGDHGQLGHIKFADSSSYSGSSYPVTVLANDELSTPLRRIVQVSAGGSHTCALTRGGEVRCWGHGGSGRLGHGIVSSNYKALFPASVISEREAGGVLRGVKKISSGANHSCALMREGKVLCWGSGASGQLGNNTNEVRYGPIFVHKAQSSTRPLDNIIEISTKGDHTCALNSGGEVLCWGDGEHGRLGNNATEDKNHPIYVLANSASTRGITIGSYQRIWSCFYQNGTCSVNPINLSFPSGFENLNKSSSPSIIVSGIKSGETLQLYQDPHCQLTIGSSLTSDGTIALSGLQDGMHFFYHKTEDRCSKNFLSYTLDSVAPDLESRDIEVPEDSTYGVGTNLDFIVNFNESVFVAGGPRIALTVGASTKYATYQSGDGTSSLTFRYLVSSGDADSDGISMATTIDLNSGSIKDAAGNNAPTTGLSIPSLTGILIDTTLSSIARSITHPTKEKSPRPPRSVLNLSTSPFELKTVDHREVLFINKKRLIRWIDFRDSRTFFSEPECIIPSNGRANPACWADKSGNDWHYRPGFSEKEEWRNGVTYVMINSSSHYESSLISVESEREFFPLAFDSDTLGIFVFDQSLNEEEKNLLEGIQLLGIL